MKTRLSTAQRFWKHVTFGHGPNACLLWSGAKLPKGYGLFDTGDREHTRVAHRLAYEWIHGPVPEGKQLDHLCRNRACVNPDHLEPVSARENTIRGTSITGRNARKTHCQQGHALVGENLASWHPNRACRTCNIINGRAYRAANREKLIADSRRYRLAHLEELRLADRLRYQRNKLVRV